jgi:hypothetical protein
MKGCVLAGKYVFSNSEAKNDRLRAKRERESRISAFKLGADGEAD